MLCIAPGYTSYFGITNKKILNTVQNVHSLENIMQIENKATPSTSIVESENDPFQKFLILCLLTKRIQKKLELFQILNLIEY
jgi:hypothetical protein